MLSADAVRPIIKTHNGDKITLEISGFIAEKHNLMEDYLFVYIVISISDNLNSY